MFTNIYLYFGLKQFHLLSPFLSLNPSDFSSSHVFTYFILIYLLVSMSTFKLQVQHQDRKSPHVCRFYSFVKWPYCQKPPTDWFSVVNIIKMPVLPSLEIAKLILHWSRSCKTLDTQGNTAQINVHKPVSCGNKEQTHAFGSSHRASNCIWCHQPPVFSC